MVGQRTCLLVLIFLLIPFSAMGWIKTFSVYHVGPPLQYNRSQSFVAAFTAPLEFKQLDHLKQYIGTKSLFEGAQRIILRSKHSNGLVKHLVLFQPENKEQLNSLFLRLEQANQVDWVYPNFDVQGDPRENGPNDSGFKQQEHHDVMQNLKAWKIHRAQKQIVVAVTDDGVDHSHEDLKNNIWHNPGEIPNNQKDDDHNGRIDDTIGWDFTDNDNDPGATRYNVHGTHIAGIIAAEINNHVGVVGTAPYAQIMPLRFYGGNKPWNAALIAETYQYAIDNGADIISTSYNIDGLKGDPIFAEAVRSVYQNQLLHFNSAGNSNYNEPRRTIFEEILLVASTESSAKYRDTKSRFSNFGIGIDLSAPGSSIYSTVPQDRYKSMSGTSMAAPNAAAVAALIWSQYPHYTRDQVAAQLIGSVDFIDDKNPRYRGWLGAGRVNSYKALSDQARPSQLEWYQIRELPEELIISLIIRGTLKTTSVALPENYTLTYAGKDHQFKSDDDEVLELKEISTYKIGSNLLKLKFKKSKAGLYRLVVKDTLKDPFNRGIDGNSNGRSSGRYMKDFEIKE